MCVLLVSVFPSRFYLPCSPFFWETLTPCGWVCPCQLLLDSLAPLRGLLADEVLVLDISSFPLLVTRLESCCLLPGFPSPLLFFLFFCFLFFPPHFASFVLRLFILSLPTRSLLRYLFYSFAPIVVSLPGCCLHVRNSLFFCCAIPIAFSQPITWNRPRFSSLVSDILLFLFGVFPLLPVLFTVICNTFRTFGLFLSYSF